MIRRAGILALALWIATPAGARAEATEARDDIGVSSSDPVQPDRAGRSLPERAGLDADPVSVAEAPAIDAEAAAALRERRRRFEDDVSRGEKLHTAGFAWTGVHVGFVLVDLIVHSIQGAVAAPFEIGEAIAMGVWTPFGVAGWAARGTREALWMEPDDSRLVDAVIVHRKRAAAEGLLYVSAVTGATALAYFLQALGTEAACAGSDEGACSPWSVGWHRVPPAPWAAASLTFLTSAGLTRLTAELDAKRLGVRSKRRFAVRATLLPVLDPRGGVHVVLGGSF